MSEQIQRYWKGAYNSRVGLAVMEQKSPDVNSQMIVAIMLPEKEAQEIADINVWFLEAEDSALNFIPDQRHTLPDMANVGRAYMRFIEENIEAPIWNNCPSEIALHLLNENADHIAAVEKLEALLREYRVDHNDYFNSVMRGDGCPCLICKRTDELIGGK